MPHVAVVNVFSKNGCGGNPCPVVIDAAGMSAAAMQDVARRYGHESCFVQPSEDDDSDFTFRFYVPNHEMDMCGHATIGALWLLARDGRLAGPTVRIATHSGLVTGYVGTGADGSPSVEITQPAGSLVALDAAQAADVMSVLGVDHDALADFPLHNARTSRVKTLVPMKDPAQLNALTTDMARVEAVCGRIGSTGLYPYAAVDLRTGTFEARQFPRSSGYPEDAATGIAAAALAFGLLSNGMIDADDRLIRIFQGRAMGRLSEIRVRFDIVDGRPVGCRLGGAVDMAQDCA